MLTGEVDAVLAHHGSATERGDADFLLLPDDFEKAAEKLISAVRSGRISMERLDESVYRILSLKAEYVPQDGFCGGTDPELLNGDVQDLKNLIF